jgi:UDP-hydrolysing UDP-N-acetyl-D-glucosamine 2-epimerase
MSRKRICFVTGSRAEFGLMQSVLSAIRAHRRSCQLQIVATGMHLDPSRGNTVQTIENLDAVVPWPPDLPRAQATGRAMADLARVFDELKTDIVLVVGDRVEAFAAAAAGAISGRLVAHVHGGDRALGQLDDSLRHAITKLSHVHFPATAASARRLKRIGEDPYHIHRVGSPAIDDITHLAARPGVLAKMFPGLHPRRYALTVFHPTDPDEKLEEHRAALIPPAILAAGVPQIVLLDPNNDPGADGIRRAWKAAAEALPSAGSDRVILRTHVPRDIFLALLRDAAMLVGNSSSGIIEAASFRTPVVDIGPRQLGRQRSADVRNVPCYAGNIRAAVAQVWDRGRAPRGTCPNPYAHDGHAGRKIAAILAQLTVTRQCLAKLISY